MRGKSILWEGGWFGVEVRCVGGGLVVKLGEVEIGVGFVVYVYWFVKFFFWLVLVKDDVVKCDVDDFDY